MSIVDTFRIYLYRSVEFPSENAVTSQLNAENQSRPTPCNGMCCAPELTEPYQPDMNYSTATRKVQGAQSRSFCKEWFADHTWLTFCVSENKAFCFYCRFAASRNLLNFSTKSEDAFAARGFENWKKAKKKFGNHERSQSHREAVLKYKALQRPSVSAQINKQIAQEQLARRQAFLTQLSSLRYLMRQGMGVRGHKEEEGNLQQLLKCRAEDVPILKEWLSHSSYKSHDIANEIIQLMAHQVLKNLLQDIHEAEWFALIADETRDISGAEQLGVSMRWVDKNYGINEDLVGLVEVEMTDASTLTSTLKDVLLRCNLQLAQCRGQAYDGASNMAGHLSGVSTRITNEEPKALYVHCLAHSLNLCLQDCSKSCRCVRDALSLATELASIIRASPKRLALFKNLKKEMALDTPGIKPLCPTRWTVRTGALDSIIKNYVVVCAELEKIGEDANDEPSRKASGLLALMDNFQTFFGLKLSFMVFSAMEQLSRTLQTSDINAQEACSAATQAGHFLKRQRSDELFTAFYRDTVKEAEDLTQPPTLPRQRRIPRRIDDGASNHHFATPQEYYRKQYFEVLDLLATELERRFDQNSFKTLQEIERVLVESCNGKSCNGKNVQFSETFVNTYATDLKFDRLAVQLSMLPDLLKTANELHQMGIKRVTSINTICEVMNTCKFAKNMLSEVDRLLRVYLTIPMSSATAERTFSSLRRLKNYLRSTMTQKRLNHVILLHTHKQRTDDLDLVSIARDFTEANSRRKAFFGNF